MTTQNISHPLYKRMARIEQMRVQLIAELEPCTEQQLSHHPASDKWNILEIIEHLLLVERGMLLAPGKKGATTPHSQKLKHVLGYYLVVGVLQSFIKVSVPSPRMRPKGNQSLAELSRGWQVNHRMLRQHVDKVVAGEIKGAVFKHPISGPITTAQALHMLEVHLKRHWKQIRRIVAHS